MWSYIGHLPRSPVIDDGRLYPPSDNPGVVIELDKKQVGLSNHVITGVIYRQPANIYGVSYRYIDLFVL